MLFKYTALTKEGEQKAGSIDAPDKDMAINSLQGRGWTIVSIEEGGKEVSFLKRRVSLFDRIPAREIVVLSRQLSTLFLAQVSANRIFRLLAAESENLLLREKLAGIADDIQGGSSISTALAKQPSVFSNFYVNMVKVGEESGTLTSVFSKLADYLDRSYELTLKTRNALMYPIFVIFTFIAVMILMLTLVFPRLADILTETGQAVPLYTRVVIGISNFFVDYGVFLLVLLIIAGVVLWRLSRSQAGKLYTSRLKLELPFMGILFKKLYLSRIADNIHIMLTSGVSIIRTLEVTAISVNNVVYERILKNALEDVKGGSSLSEAFSGYPEMPGIIVQIIKVGEESGELGSVLEMLAKFYRREVNNTVDVLVGLIEPFLIIALAVGVGLILGSVLIPIYNIATGF